MKQSSFTWWQCRTFIWSLTFLLSSLKCIGYKRSWQALSALLLPSGLAVSPLPLLFSIPFTPTLSPNFPIIWTTLCFGWPSPLPSLGFYDPANSLAMKVKYEKFGKRTFLFTGTKIFNNLPLTIVKSENILTFCCREISFYRNCNNLMRFLGLNVIFIVFLGFWNSS